MAQHPATAAWQQTCYSFVFPRLGSTSFGQLPPALIANHSRPACVPRYHSRLPTQAGKFRVKALVAKPGLSFHKPFTALLDNLL